MNLLYFNGATYLLVVDYFSRYPEITKLTTTTSASVVMALKTIFARHGIPETVVSDNGPQFASGEFNNFAKKYSFSHITSSPHFPQSNGQAERTVQTIKKILTEAEDPSMAMLVYRSTPYSWCSRSPVELLMGRHIRSNIPQVKAQLIPAWDYLKDFRQKNQDYKMKQKDDYDSRH